MRQPTKEEIQKGLDTIETLCNDMTEDIKSKTTPYDVHIFRKMVEWQKTKRQRNKLNNLQ